MNFDGLEPSILGPAFLAGLLVLSTHVPMGREVLARGIIFIDLAVAQIAGLGVIAAAALGWEAQGWVVQITAVGSALLGALALHWTERRWPEVQEALIGVTFALAATAGMILLSHNPHGGEHLKDMLVGQILWVSYGQLAPIAALYALVLGVWLFSGANRSRLLFYLLFALSVTASVQLVGVYLVFASLIIPALAVRRLQGWTAVASAYGLGALGYALGLSASGVWDLPAGATVVWGLALAALVGRTVKRT